jgi:6-pyruvoyltetrahydropterin/6-carboxytetrahydropterin synthase
MNIVKLNSTMKVTISRKAHFNSAHRLYRKDWTSEKRCFWKCNNPNFTVTIMN